MGNYKLVTKEQADEIVSIIKQCITEHQLERKQILCVLRERYNVSDGSYAGFHRKALSSMVKMDGVGRIAGHELPPGKFEEKVKTVRRGMSAEEKKAEMEALVKAAIPEKLRWERERKVIEFIREPKSNL